MNPSDEATTLRVLEEMAAAIAANDWRAAEAAYESVDRIEPVSVQVDILNHLLVMPGHTVHQRVAWDIQRLRSPSSIPFIRQVLEGGFQSLEYTASDSEVIAKWFSHALAKINTPESIALIREFASSKDPGVAEEMRYRLEKLDV